MYWFPETPQGILGRAILREAVFVSRGKSYVSDGGARGGAPSLPPAGGGEPARYEDFEKQRVETRQKFV